jgi:hypothetical protein
MFRQESLVAVEVVEFVVGMGSVVRASTIITYMITRTVTITETMTTEVGGLLGMDREFKFDKNEAESSAPQ